MRHQPWSVTKTFIAATVGIAVAEGKVRSVQDRIEAYIPELKGTAWEGARIVDVLQMRSGVFWDEDDPGARSATRRCSSGCRPRSTSSRRASSGRAATSSSRRCRRRREPGTKWRYNSGATQVLAWLTEKVYGKPFNEIISEKLWQPAGMDGDARILTDRVGDAIASQGLYSRVFDLARFGELLRNDGRTPEGRQVVPAAWVHDMTTLLEAPKGAYGYQTWIGPMPGTFQASGFQGQKISVAPAHCLTGVRLSHSFGVDTRPGDGPAENPESYGFGTEFHAKEWNAMYRAVAEHLGGCEPRRAASTTAPQLRRTRTALPRRGAAPRRASHPHRRPRPADASHVDRDDDKRTARRRPPDDDRPGPRPLDQPPADRRRPQVAAPSSDDPPHPPRHAPPAATRRGA